MKKPRTVAIIQVRMGSTRLPGKVMMKIGGRPLFVYLSERIAEARSVDSVIVATTTNPRDNVIVEECERSGIANFRGSETDVLGRYVSAARACQADIIVRVTGDNPFTDPESIDRVVAAIAQRGADYAIEANLPIGTTGEALSWKGLLYLDSVSSAARHREHVTLYAKENPGALNCEFLNPEPVLNRPELNFTVDSLNEYLYVREIAETLPAGGFGLKEIIAVADDSRVEVQQPA